MYCQLQTAHECEKRLGVIRGFLALRVVVGGGSWLPLPCGHLPEVIESGHLVALLRRVESLVA